jgi:hypothetical protein
MGMKEAIENAVEVDFFDLFPVSDKKLLKEEDMNPMIRKDMPCMEDVFKACATMSQFVCTATDIFDEQIEFEECIKDYLFKMKASATAKLNEERNKPEDEEPDMRIIGQSEGILEIINDISNLYHENETKIHKKLDGGEEDAS